MVCNMNNLLLEDIAPVIESCTTFLFDSYNRKHDYLRISITENCNMNCFYCMPDDKKSLHAPAQWMTKDEIINLAKIFVDAGVKKIRITGGEPLIRKDAKEIIKELSKLPVELTLTTNGVLVDKFIEAFHEAGIRSLNVSLDTLDREKYFKITKQNYFERVFDNIKILCMENFIVKVNVVIIKGLNDGEILNFIELTRNLPIHIRFIEFMPFAGNGWNSNMVVTSDEILAKAGAKYIIYSQRAIKHDTSRNYFVKDYQGTFGMISSMSQPFCGDCNRLRITADGRMKNCLFSCNEVDLLKAMRNGDDILPLIRQSLIGKYKERGNQFEDNFLETDAHNMINRSMVAIGG